MNLLFMHQPVDYPINQRTKDIGVPLGMMLLSGYLRHHNPDVNVTLLDDRLDQFLNRNVPLEDAMQDHDIVAVGSSTADFSKAYEIMQRAKKLGKTTIMGGIFPTLMADYVLRLGAVDFIVRGEGEETLSELLKAEDKTAIAGVSFVREGQVVHNPNRLAKDLSQLSMPDYSLVDVQSYIDLKHAPIYSARGCPQKCSFCTLNEYWNYSHRTHGVDRVIEEVTALADLGFKDIRFKDEDFTINRKRALTILREIEKLDLDVRFKAKTRIDRIKPEILEAMQRAGMTTIYFGVESFASETLQNVKKGYSSVEDQIKMVVDSGMNLQLGFVLGLAGETKETLEKNVEGISRVGSQPHVTPRICFLTPYPGTQLWREPEGLRILTNDWNRYNSIFPVAVPESLGEDGLGLLVEAQKRIVEATGRPEINPPVPEEYLKEVGLKQVA
jgi:anaerobic magnesium-protoporphyrin IX monomethyl ester cyclase